MNNEMSSFHPDVAMRRVGKLDPRRVNQLCIQEILEEVNQVCDEIRVALNYIFYLDDVHVSLKLK